MKKMRKIFAVLLTLAMVLAMSIPTFAAEKNNTITISGKGLDAEGAGANYGQIIEENRQSTLGWKFATDDATTSKFAGDNVAVVAKGAKDQLNKKVAENGQSVAPGDEVNYIIDEEYLYIAPNANPKTFTITDTLTNGKFKENSVEVVLKDSIDATTSTELIANTDYEINEYANGTTLTVDFTNHYNNAYCL